MKQTRSKEQKLMTNQFFKFFSKTKNSKEDNSADHFKSILSFALEILDSDHPKVIYDLIYSLGKPYQIKLINDCVMGNSLSRDSAPFEEHLFFKHIHKKYSLKKTDISGSYKNYSKPTTKKTLLPNETLIFTFPWHNKRLSDAFSTIGKKVGNPWMHDSLNHRVTYIFPINIGYVTNGNHSTAINILNNEAPMNVTEELDLTTIYDEIYTDGLYFKRVDDDSIVDRVASIEFAAIFEIGRMILNKNITI
jgi:hypothetical protein